MKISNETKVGALTIVSVVFLLLGFNYLKGKNLFKSGNFLQAQFSEIKGLMVSNPVYAKGYQIGTVYHIENADPSLQKINITIQLKDNYNIPVNSTASIASNPLGTTSVDISLGDAPTYLAKDASITTKEPNGLLQNMQKEVKPMVVKINGILTNMDSLLKGINAILNPQSKLHIQQLIKKTDDAMQALALSMQSIQKAVDPKTGTLTKTLENFESISTNLASNSPKITKTITNFQQISDQLAAANLKSTLQTMDNTLKKLESIVQKIDNKEGSLGLLINDKTLYNQLTNTIKSTQILMEDLRMNPSRYISFSVFGKKEKLQPLMQPLSDSSIKKINK